ncbi:autotransporter domain-containing protein [Thermomonas brevis]|uniref:Autotransporter domain-containing protein n=1 Tax=Thermomonas brevis TaxID=215691 RepID=A0A7G9QR22_9GAMM|nr:autotransporter domain-containing protein [Thermomonas brevis]QNN45797.1 autotransporter domain-containing protein [Thermomonas brevis]
MKTLFRRTLLSAALAVVAMPALAQTAPSSPFTSTVFFGDSLTDGGYFRPLLTQMLGPNGSIIGQFTTNPGYVWSQHLASYYGGNAAPAWTGNTTATPTAGSGDNWAVGGARTGTTTVGGLGLTPSLTAQYQAYLGAGNTVDPGALYTVWGGANDLFYATGVFQATLGGGGSMQQAQAAAQAVVGQAVTAQAGMIGALNAAGAQYILVPNVPDLGMTPSYISQGAAAQALGTSLTTAYNDALFGGLATANVSVIPLDTFHFLHEVVDNPSAFGLTNVTGQACLPQPAPAGDSSLFCTALSSVPGSASSYLFADGVHPTTAAHEALADFAISVIDGPRMISLLPRSATTTGRARAAMVDGAAAGIASAEGDGMHWWADLRGQQQRFVKSTGFDGIGGTGSFGIGWRSGNLMYGAFAGYGRQDVDFGYRRGDFRQTDSSVGGFVGWTGDGLWANGQLSWTKLGYKVDRQVVLGQASRTHNGSPDGDNFSAGASVGWNFSHGAWQHGPVLSLLAQKISVDGYAENSTQSTALAYPKQDVDSLIGSAGWQVSYAMSEHLRPYMRLTWDREFEDAPAQAWAQSLSMPGTLPYAVPGVAFDDSYGTVGLGVRTKLLGLDVTAGANVTVEQMGGSDTSVFVTFGGAF